MLQKISSGADMAEDSTATVQANGQSSKENARTYLCFDTHAMEIRIEDAQSFAEVSHDHSYCVN